MVLKHKDFFKQGKGKNKHIIYQYPYYKHKTIIRKIIAAIVMRFNRKNITVVKHILRPITDHKICDFAWCGVNVEDGRPYCDAHRLTCERCNKKEIDIIVNGIGICWDCNGSFTDEYTKV